MSNPNVIELFDNSTGATAKILVGLGLNCFSFRPVVDGQAIEVLWAHEDFAAGKQRASSSGIPLMFPFAGRLRGKTLEYEGKTYMLNAGDAAGNAIHGYVLDRAWRVIHHAPAELVAQFQASVDDAERVACWPADYVVTATYAVRGNRLSLDVVVENPTTSVLPFAFGTHPYFRVPLGSGDATQCTIRVPATEYWELENMLPNGRKLPCDEARDLAGGKPFDETQLDDVLTNLTSDNNRVTTQLADAASGRTMTMMFDETFRQCVVYNPPHREAFCIEPITCVPNAYELAKDNIATGLRVLQPSEEFRANVEIEVS